MPPSIPSRIPLVHHLRRAIPCGDLLSTDQPQFAAVAINQTELKISTHAQVHTTQIEGQIWASTRKAVLVPYSL